jgi:hypothetical protein
MSDGRTPKLRSQVLGGSDFIWLTSWVRVGLHLYGHDTSWNVNFKAD